MLILFSFRAKIASAHCHQVSPLQMPKNTSQAYCGTWKHIDMGEGVVSDCIYIHSNCANVTLSTINEDAVPTMATTTGGVPVHRHLRYATCKKS